MSSILISALIPAVILVAVYQLCWPRFSKSVKLPYPPGPKGKPLIGNIFDVSTNRPWYQLTSWKKIYGGIVYLRVPGIHILIINSRDDAFELLEKRSKIYSDRPYLGASEMMGWDFNTASMKYSDRWRSHRKLFQQFLRSGEVDKFLPIQESNVNKMLRDMLKSPRPAEHYRRLPGSIIMKVIYDIDISEEEHEYYVEMAQEAEHNIGKIAYLSWLFPRIFPLVEYVPGWVPGAGSIQRVIRETKVMTHKMLTVPFEYALRNPDPLSSVAMRLLTESIIEADGGESRHTIQDVCATAYAAGADTSVSVISTFFYAMLESPEAQKKAQKEIDEVIGNSRLPNYDDRDSLPYVEAVFREVLRWYPVLPLTLPRITTEDDIYNGYFIPKGTMVIPNAWAMTHDEAVYPNPDEFIPERFLNEDGGINDDQSNLAFGFGRRVCPGGHFAHTTVWLTIAKVLSVYDIRHAKDENGNDIPVSGEYTNEVVSHHVPFECSVTPRSDAARELILNSK